MRILNPNIAEIVSSTPSAATGGLTSTTVKVRGLKTGSTVLIATDSLTGKTVATHITVSEGFSILHVTSLVVVVDVLNNENTVADEVAVTSASSVG